MLLIEYRGFGVLGFWGFGVLGPTSAHTTPSKPSIRMACPTTRPSWPPSTAWPTTPPPCCSAPEAEPFVGPAIFSGRASGVFFHEIFGHRMEGHRQKDESEGQTFTKSVGTLVLPSFLSVLFDPTQRKIDGIDLIGWYDYDDEEELLRPLKDQDLDYLMNELIYGNADRLHEGSDQKRQTNRRDQKQQDDNGDEDCPAT